MNKFIRKLSVICLLLTLCLAVIGVGYASWSKNLYIQGTVSTGDVDIDFVSSTVVISDNEAPGNDVGSVTVNFDSWSDTDDPDDPGAYYNKMALGMNHVYKDYIGYVEFRIRNNGTVPVQLTYVIDPVPGLQVGFQATDIDMNAEPPGVQLEPGQTAYCKLMAKVTTDISGEHSGASVHFTGVQYNKAGGGG